MNNEFTKREIQQSNQVLFSNSKELLSSCNVFIITVPTPISKNKKPDLTSLKSATSLVGEVMSKDNIVVYESTVYPGATEEVCIPILEKTSGLIANKDFQYGYSPERINPETN